MEQCSYIAASRLRGWHLLTAGMDSVRFAASTRVGDVLYITAQVTAIFSSSLEVMVSVYGESPTASPGPFHCADAFATVVVVGQEGGPQSVPFELAPATATEQLRCQVGEYGERVQTLCHVTCPPAPAAAVQLRYMWE